MAAGADDTDMEDTLDSSVVEPGRHGLLMTDIHKDGRTNLVEDAMAAGDPDDMDMEDTLYSSVVESGI